MSAEDALIAKIILHRDIKLLVMQIFQKYEIEHCETAFTDPNGDILLVKSEDIEKVKAIVRAIQQQARQ